MRRFELSEGASNKFWEIELTGSEFSVTYGKIGTAGQTQTKTFDSAEKARAEHDKLVSEKLKKGYNEIGGKHGDTKSSPSPAMQPAQSSTVAKLDPIVARLDAWLRKKRAKFYSRLNPGAPTAELDALEAHIGEKLPQAMRQLYLWRNGQEGGIGEAFESSFEWMPLSEVRTWHRGRSFVENSAAKRKAKKLKQEDGSTLGWLPFLLSPIQQMTAVDTIGILSKKPGSIVEFDMVEKEWRTVAPSFEAWLKAFVELLEAGKYVLERKDDGVAIREFIATGDMAMKIWNRHCKGCPTRFTRLSAK